MDEKLKKRGGDRKDGYLVRDLDVLHVFMPFLMPNRADNEAFIRELIDITAIQAYIDKKNGENPQYRYTLMHVILAALGRTVAERPLMNRFIAGYRLYDRKKISFSFVAKKQFSDDGSESLVVMDYDKDSELSAIDVIHDTVCSRVNAVRHEGADDVISGPMTVLAKLPRPVLKFVMWVLRTLDYYGKAPDDLTKGDPDYTSVFVTNLGSIGLNAGYHHLANWGTNSVFVVIGEKHKHPYYDDAGNVTMKDALELGITLDERIGDGYYFARTIRLLKHYLAHPELLDHPAKEDLKLEY